LALDTTDEEQVEALKNWWKDNGTSLLAGVLVVVAVSFGIRKWQDSQSVNAGEASDLYEQIGSMSVANLGKAISDDELLAAQNVYTQLKEQHASSVYTRFAALAMAKFHAEKGELDQAAAELQWVLDHQSIGLLKKADPELFLVAKQRLARIRLAQGDAKAALALVRGVDAGSFVNTFSETEGDALLQLGDKEGAKAAYQKALAASGDTNPAVLKLKLQDLGVSSVEISQ
jgi:predicted negative regulator of RcsB-dependent stress response